jgi:hypothetical protein
MSYKALSDILETEYGVDALGAPPEAVIWAAERLPKDQAVSELSALNRAREKHGKVLVYVPYGHSLFQTDDRRKHEQ